MHLFQGWFDSRHLEGGKGHGPQNNLQRSPYFHKNKIKNIPGKFFLYFILNDETIIRKTADEWREKSSGFSKEDIFFFLYLSQSPCLINQFPDKRDNDGKNEQIFATKLSWSGRITPLNNYLMTVVMKAYFLNFLQIYVIFT